MPTTEKVNSVNMELVELTGNIKQTPATQTSFLCSVIASHWNSCGQHEYLLIYSFKLKSVFDVRSLLLIPPVSFFAVRCTDRRTDGQKTVSFQIPIADRLITKNAVISRGELCDAAVNFDTH